MNKERVGYFLGKKYFIVASHFFRLVCANKRDDSIPHVQHARYQTPGDNNMTTIW